MKNLSNKVYLAILVISFIIFIGSISYIYREFQYAYWNVESSKLSNKIDSVESDIEYGPITTIWDTLYYTEAIESEFDPYWELATTEQYYLHGLALQRALHAGDFSAQAKLDTCISYIEDYIATETNILHQNLAKDYLKKLSNP